MYTRAIGRDHDRCVELFSNPGEVFTPFMGAGSEVYSPVIPRPAWHWGRAEMTTDKQ